MISTNNSNYHNSGHLDIESAPTPSAQSQIGPVKETEETVSLFEQQLRS